MVKGEASDDTSLQSVLVRLDGGEWELANGTESWHLDIPNDRLSEGPHTIEAMSFDGVKYSEVDSVEFEFSEVEPRTSSPWPIILVLVIIIGTIVVLYLRRSMAKSVTVFA